MRRAIPLVLVVAAALPASARADCCTALGAEIGPLVPGGPGAVLSWSGWDTAGADDPVRQGALTTLAPDGRLRGAQLPGIAGEEVPHPALGGAAGALATAWVVAGEAQSAAVGADGTLSGRVGESAAPGAFGATRAEPPVAATLGVVPAPDGSRLLAFAHGTAVVVRRVAPDPQPAPSGSASTGATGATGPTGSGGATAPDTLLGSRAQDGEVAVVGDAGGGALVVWRATSGLMARTVAPGANPAAGLGPVRAFTRASGRLLGLAPDGAGGAGAVVAADRATRLILLPAAGGSRTIVLAGGGGGLTPNAAIAPGAVGYLARGRAGRADVVVRSWSAAGAGPPQFATRSVRPERGVSAVTAAGGAITVLYGRLASVRSRPELYLRRLGSPARNVTRTAGADHDGRLAVGADGTTYVAWQVDRRLGASSGGVTCTDVRAGVVGRPSRLVARCAITTTE